MPLMMHTHCVRGLWILHSLIWILHLPSNLVKTKLPLWGHFPSPTFLTPHWLFHLSHSAQPDTSQTPEVWQKPCEVLLHPHAPPSFVPFKVLAPSSLGYSGIGKILFQTLERVVWEYFKIGRCAGFKCLLCQKRKTIVVNKS